MTAQTMPPKLRWSVELDADVICWVAKRRNLTYAAYRIRETFQVDVVSLRVVAKSPNSGALHITDKLLVPCSLRFNRVSPA
jgi:hypothetical protein